MVGLIKLFFRAPEANPWVVLGCLLLAGLFEGFGISTILPMLTLVSGNSGTDSTLTRLITEALATVGLTPSLGLLLLLGVTGIFLKAVFSILAMSYVGYAGAAVATRLRRQLVGNLLDVRWSYFTDLPVGRVANAISVEATRATHTYVSVAVMIKNIIETGVFLTVAVLVSWKLAVAAIVVGGGIAASLQFLVKLVRRAAKQQTHRTQQLVTYFNDVLNNIKPLKAMAAQSLFAVLIQKRIAQVNRAMQKQVIGKYLLKHSEEFLVVLTMAAGFYVANVLWAVPVSEFVVIGFLLFTSVNSVGRIQREYQLAVMHEPPFRNVERFIAEAAAAKEHNPGRAVPTFTQGCRLDNIVFAHGSLPVLDGLTLDIPARGVTVITGVSGAGKTTLMDLILGLYRPSAGKVLIDGVSLEDIDLDRWRAMVGYVPQELALLHDTVLTNATLGDQAIDAAAVRAALEAAGVWDFVAAQPDGLEAQVGDKGARLSGGQRQRIALARALVRQPKLLILDEVTSALDPATERQICASIRALGTDLAVLAITHRDVWSEIADRVYRIEAGKAVADDRRPAGTRAVSA